MRAVLSLLCCLTLSVNVVPEAEPGLVRSQKIAAAEALLAEISSRRADREAEGLPDDLSQAVDAWTDDRRGE